MSEHKCDNFRKGEPWVKGRDCSRCWSAYHRGSLRADSPAIQEPAPVALCNDRGRAVYVPEHPLRMYVICEGESEHNGKPVCTCIECNPTCRGYNA